MSGALVNALLADAEKTAIWHLDISAWTRARTAMHKAAQKFLPPMSLF